MRHGSDRMVLCYHAVSVGWPADVAVTPGQLTEQVGYLAEQGYRGVTFSELALGETEGKVVAITFDDGYASVAKLARPILDLFGMPGTVFAPTDFIDHGPISWQRVGRWAHTPYDHELESMSWNQLRALSAAGWEIGSHTRAHTRLTGVSDESLEAELSGSRRACEQALDASCRSLAFPYGDHDSRVVDAARQAGYSAGATLLAGKGADSPMRWPRVPVTRRDSFPLFRLKTSNVVRGSSFLTSVARAPHLIGSRKGDGPEVGSHA